MKVYITKKNKKTTTLYRKAKKKKALAGLVCLMTSA